MTEQNDMIQSFLFEHHPIRGEIVRLHESFITISQQHTYPGVVKKLLGETLLAAVLLAEAIKFKGQLTIQFQSKGPIKLLVAKCDHQRHIRGLAQFDAHALSDDILTALGEGELIITIERDDAVRPYQSIVPLQNRTVMEALEFYFGQSEQLPTKFLTVLSEEQAVGLILQMMPSDKIIDRENFWKYASRLEEPGVAERLFQANNVGFLQGVFPEQDIRIYETYDVSFKCNCSVLRMADAVRVLGEQEAMSILRDKQQIVVTCEYCNNEYGFDREEVLKIFSKQ